MSKRKSERYIVEYNYKTEFELDEIDFDLQSELKIKENDSNMGTLNNGESLWSGESFPINIDIVIEVLNEFKKKNKCNYVEIVYHSDHIGYIFNGLNITKHLEGSKGYNTCINKIVLRDGLDKEKKIQKLQDELERLKSGK